jgi:hypothetical protein
MPPSDRNWQQRALFTIAEYQIELDWPPSSMSWLGCWRQSKSFDHSDRSACVGSIDVARHTGPTAAMNPINPRSVTTAA